MMTFEDYVFEFCLKTIAPVPNEILIYKYKSESTPNDVVQAFLIYCLKAGIPSDYILYDQIGIDPMELRCYAKERAH